MIPALELKNVSHAFGRRYALRNVNLTLAPGEAVALTGGNGAGKTTLLQIAATLLEPTGGEALLFGDPLDESRETIRPRIGALFVQSFLYRELTVGENLRLYASLQGFRDAVERVRRWLERVGMTAFEDARVSTLSTGEKQRVSLARSLLHDPELWIWDEPMTGLDEGARGLVNELALEHRGKRTILCATHDPKLMESWVTRSVRLEGGRLA